jgi:hypothetical protein
VDKDWGCVDKAAQEKSEENLQVEDDRFLRKNPIERHSNGILHKHDQPKRNAIKQWKNEGLGWDRDWGFMTRARQEQSEDLAPPLAEDLSLHERMNVSSYGYGN